MIGIIFDLDGTLWDSTKPISDAWNEVFKCNNIPIHVTSKTIKQLLGKTNNEIMKQMFFNLSKDEKIKLMKQCEYKELSILNKNGGLLYSELENTLKVLEEKYQLFIVSNCQAGYIETFLNFHRLSKYIKDFESAGNTNMPKSENISSIMKRHNINFAIYVGDTVGDYIASEKANVKFIYANYGFGKVSNSKYEISNLKELPLIIEKIIKETDN